MRDKDFIESELSRCNKCGYCMQSCPVYRTVRREAEVARARNQLLRAATEGQSGVTRDMLQPFFNCLLCGACTTDCFGKVNTKELMVLAREAFHAQHGQPAIQRFIFRSLLPNPEKLKKFVRLASLGKQSGLSKVAQTFGLLRWLNPSLAAADKLVDAMPRTFLRDRLAEMGFVSEGDALRLDPEHATGPKVLYFIGCGTNFQLPETGEAAIRMLSLAGCQVIVAPNNCCGLPPYSYGDTQAAEMLAQQNVDLLANLDFDVLVSECGSCSGFLKEYAELLPDAKGMVEKTRDLTELLATLTLPKPMETGGTVTYHDPCHLARQQGIIEQPRKLLVDAGGLKLIEMAEADWCCGGAGSYNITHPEMSQEILARKMSRIAETGAEIVSTACPACLIQIQSGDRRLIVRHVIELLAERQGWREK